MICAALLQTRLAASRHWFGWCLSPQLLVSSSACMSAWSERAKVAARLIRGTSLRGRQSELHRAVGRCARGAQALVRGLGVVSDKEGGPAGDEVEQWTKRLPLRPPSVPLREASMPPASASDLEFHGRAPPNYWTVYPFAVMQAVKAWP
jgi:hypothetical protein